MTTPANTTTTASRRAFLRSTLGAAAAVATSMYVGGCGPSSGGKRLSIGIIALTDCSPVVIAKEKGLFAKYGLDVTVKKGASWRAIHDSLSNGDIQASHILLGMPIASSMGLLGGGVKIPMVVPWMLNRNGQSISLKATYKGKVGVDAAAMKPFVDRAKSNGKPLTFAMTFPPGTHAMWMRYWLASGGIHPDRDVSLKVVPPPNMVEQMETGAMDGFCVGEPWNARTVAKKIGYTALNTQDMWKDHPEKVIAFTDYYAKKYPETVKSVCKALHEASVWLDNLANRPEACAIVSKPDYINCDKDLILGRMLGQYDFGDGRAQTYDKHYMTFHDRNCNYPQYKYATWWLTQFRRWGMVTGTPDYAGVARQVMRPDIYEAAMAEAKFEHLGPDDSPETLFDGRTFDPADPETYAASFPIHSMKG